MFSVFLSRRPIVVSLARHVSICGGLLFLSATGWPDLLLLLQGLPCADTTISFDAIYSVLGRLTILNSY